MEVAEIADGTVSLAAMAREPAMHKSMCQSTDPKVDPVEWRWCERFRVKASSVK